MWCQVKDDNVDIIVGICYRSPASGEANNNQLLDLLNQACNFGRNKHLLIMGDFNYPNINFNDSTAGCDKTTVNRFITRSPPIGGEAKRRSGD